MIYVEDIENDLLSSASYIISKDNSDKCWLVDVGDFHELEKHLKKHMVLAGVFLTHCHFDHIRGINDLIKAYPECKVFTSEFGEKMLRSDKLNFSRYHEKSVVYLGESQILKDGDSLRLYEDEYMYVMATPGHCPSCLTYQIDNFLFTGDSYIPWCDVISKLPRGDKKLAMESVQKIKSLITNNTMVKPGHWRRKAVVNV